ncbi:MAG: MFS transporter [Candidatus Asgardarchaeia archaeon]
MARRISYPLFAMSLLHFINDANVLLIPTVLPLIIAEFNLSYTQVGLLTGLIPLAMVFLQFPLGYISDVKGKKNLLSFGIFLVGFGTIISGLSKTYLELLFAQLIIGIGASFYHPLGYSLTSSLYETKERGGALGIQSSMGDFGILVIFAVNGYLALLGGWRLPMLIFGTLAMASSIFPLLVKENKASIELRKHKINIRKILSWNVLAVFLMYALLSAGYKVFYTYFSPYLTTKGLEITSINLILAAATFSGIIGGLATGFLIDKYTEIKPLLASSFMLVIFSFVFAILKTRNIFWIFINILVLGLCLYGLYPGLYYTLSESVDRNVLGVTYGLLLSIGTIGGFLGTVTTGVISDIFGVGAALWMFSLIMLSLFLTLLITVLKSNENKTKKATVDDID